MIGLRMINHFEAKLSGGHPNSLGNTEAVVEEVLEDHRKLQDLFDCYRSNDAVVRLRVSSAMKRLSKAKPEWIMEYMDRLQTEICALDQPSAKWSIAQIFMWLDTRLSKAQRLLAIEIMKNNLEAESDWIVQNTTAESLAHFSKNNLALQKWLRPRLEKMRHDKRSSVARKATKLLSTLGTTN